MEFVFQIFSKQRHAPDTTLRPELSQRQSDGQSSAGVG
jgi:hypothetical protein